MGASIGGMQALELAIRFPERVARVILHRGRAPGRDGPGLNHLQRQMILLDPAWKGGHYSPDAPPPRTGAGPRAGVCTYKSAELFEHRFARKPDRSGEDPWTSMRACPAAASMSPDTSTTRARDSSSASMPTPTSPSRGPWTPSIPPAATPLPKAFRRIQARVMLVGISSDWLFPAEEVAALAAAIEAPASAANTAS